MLHSKIKRKKSPFIIHAVFQSVLVPENNGQKNPEESYTNKYQKHITCSYGYKLVYVVNKFSKLFETYLVEDAIYNFINSMMEERKYSSDVIIKHLTKNL